MVAVAIGLAIAESLGGSFFRDAISDQVTGIGAWPDLLQNIGEVNAVFKNPIDIFSTGIRFRGQMNVMSFFALTTIDFANSGGAYALQASNPVNFNGGLPLPESGAFWDFDDGDSSNDRNPSHRYGDSGLYIAKLQINVNQDGGATTRHFAPVYLQNVPPTVTLGPPITVNEGEEFEIVGSFTDPEWLDTHTARFDFGDNSKPVNAVVNETNEFPEAVGTASARHTYCDNGVFTVRLTVEDDDGGIGEAYMQVTVENVPPVVETPERLCVIKDQPVIMQGRFTDQGWCDTHVASWDLGDCTVRSAVVEETNEPPQAEGTVEVCHTYDCCGNFLARLTVTDDDGGVGASTTVVEVVELKNASIEDGFRRIMSDQQRVDLVANEWYPYEAVFPSLDKEALGAPRSAGFVADEFVIRDGQRAQRIDFRGTIQAGIYQQICANPGWDYEFSAKYHLPSPATGHARIGIDPTGGIDPSSSDIVWVEASSTLDWTDLSVRATARTRQITLFLGGVERHGGVNSIFWDRASLCFIQPFCPEEEVCEERCIEFGDLPLNASFTGPFAYQGLLVSPLGLPVYSTTIGDPAGVLKLGFPGTGVRFDLPGPVDKLSITVNNYAGRLLHFSVYQGAVLIRQFSEIVFNEVKEIVIEEDGMTAIEVSGGDNEASVIRLCACFPEREPDPVDPCKPTCIDFDHLGPNDFFTGPFNHNQVTFTPLGGALFPTTNGTPFGQLKLGFEDDGVRMDFPVPVDEVRLTVSNDGRPPIKITVFDGATIIDSFVELIENNVRVILVQQPNITAIEVSGGSREAALVEVCLCLPEIPGTASGGEQ